MQLKVKKEKVENLKKVKNSYYKLKKSYLIMNLIQRKIMAFRNLFKDNNDINDIRLFWYCRSRKNI